MSDNKKVSAFALIMYGVNMILFSLLALMLGGVVVRLPSELGYSPSMFMGTVYEIIAVPLSAIGFYLCLAFFMKRYYHGTTDIPGIYSWAYAVVHQTRLRGVPNVEQWAEEPPTPAERRRLLTFGVGLPIAALVLLPIIPLGLIVPVLAAGALIHLAREDIWPVRPLSWHLALAGIGMMTAFPLAYLGIRLLNRFRTGWFFDIFNWSLGLFAPLGDVGTINVFVYLVTLPLSFASMAFATAYCWVLLYDARNLAGESSPRTDASDPPSRIRQETVLLVMMASGLVSVTLATWAGAGGSNAAAALVASSGLGALVAFRAEGFPPVLVTEADWLAGIVGALVGMAVLAAMPLFGATSGMPRADGWWVAFAVVGFVVGTLANRARTGRRADMETPHAD